jgi:outer membrane protein assembly factor BamC
MMLLRRYALPAVLALALAGCSWFGGNKPDYKGAAQARADQPLEVPPELSAPTMDDRYSIPDPHSQTTYSDYSKQAARGEAGTARATVLPPIQGAKLERDRDTRWLVVKGDPDKVWPVIRQFWIDNGYALTRESPEVGIMETDWHEDRSKIPQDFIRRTVGRVIDNLWSTPRRDKFRTRLEKGAEPGTTEVYVSNRAMEEIYTNRDETTTAWQPLPADRELEAEMLARLMVKLGGEQTKVAGEQPKAPAGMPSAMPVAAPAQANALLENNGAGPLVLNDGFDRAWRRVGLALDRTGFTVEDRDRSKGVFFVRYIDPEADASTGGKDEGFLGKLAFWKPSPKAPKPQYRILVTESGTSTSQVKVQDGNGGNDTSSTGKKILAVLYEQLK